MKNPIILCLLAISFISGQEATAKATSVAVVSDPLTYKEAKTEIDSYVQSITTDGRKGILLIDRWGIPDSLRNEFIRMYRDEGLEGAVLIGDVPVPMVRDAQHLCSAFKMNQKMPWRRSSVPSDRYYDDFGLSFTFLKSEDGLFYYSLNADGDQKVRCDIYTSRIRPAQTPEKYIQIKEYLNKAVRAKAEANPLDNALFFAGHGYNSQSMFARMEEHNVLMQQLPTLDGPEGRLDYIDHSFDEAVKYRLLSALGQDRLDLAILHHHGAPDTQYMNGSPYTSSPDGWLKLAKNYFRSKMASASDPTETRRHFIERFGIPGQWLDEAADKEVMAKDSLWALTMDISMDDLKATKIAAKAVIFDACFNGAFIEDDYVAANYLFNPGNKTIVARAHSVNTLQDKWEDELVGLLGRGICAGNWAKVSMDLDTHLFGDPTFCFGPRSVTDRQLSERAGAKVWKKYLAGKDSELRCLALRKLWESGTLTEAELLSIQSGDEARTVRLEALICAAESHVTDLATHIELGLRDNYELTSRLAAKYAGRNRSPKLVPTAVEMYANPLTTNRVIFQLKNFLTDADYALIESSFAKTPYWKGPEEQEMLLQSFRSLQKSEAAECVNLASESPVMRDAKLFIRKQRNECNAAAIEAMTAAYSKTADKEFKLLIAETFGWYACSYRRTDVISACESLLASEQDSDLASELKKTLSRLK